MCSFDVFLYYQIPLDEIIQSCLTKLYFPSDPPTLPRSVLKDLLEFATKRKATCYSMANIMIRSVVSYGGEYWTKLLLDRVPWNIYICMVMYPVISYRSRCVAL